jgi:hypothetical protein
MTVSFTAEERNYDDDGIPWERGSTGLPTDLDAEMIIALEAGEGPVEVAWITFYDDDGMPFAEGGAALYLPSCRRIGIAWGAYADWADADSLAEGIRIYDEDPELFEQLN